MQFKKIFKNLWILQLSGRLCVPSVFFFSSYDIMRSCWHKMPTLRPSFEQLEHDIDALLNIARFSQAAAAQEDYDDTVVAAKVPADNDAKDYLLIVPHPYNKYEEVNETQSGSRRNSMCQLLEGNPTDLGYDKVKSSVVIDIHNMPVEVVKPVGNAAVNNNNENDGYLVPVRDPQPEDTGGYTVPIKFGQDSVSFKPSKDHREVRDDYLEPIVNQGIPRDSGSDSEQFKDNPAYMSTDFLEDKKKVKGNITENVPSTESCPPMNKSEKPAENFESDLQVKPENEAATQPLEDYKQISNSSPLYLVKPKKSPRLYSKYKEPQNTSPKESLKASPRASPKTIPQSLQSKDSPKHSPKPSAEHKRNDLDFDKPVPKPKPKPKPMALDSVVPPRSAVEGYLPMNKHQNPNPKNLNDSTESARERESDGYLVPVSLVESDTGDYLTAVPTSRNAVSTSENDDYLVPVSNSSNYDDYVRPGTVTTAPSSSCDSDYDNRKPYA